MGAGRLVEVHADAHPLQLGDHFSGAEMLFAAAAHEEIPHLPVETAGILEHTVEARLQVHAEERTAEGAQIGKPVQMGQYGVEGLESAPRQSCHGTVLASRLAAERLFHHRDEVLQHHGVERCTVLSPLRFHILSRTWREAHLNVAALHHHNHRLTFAGGYQVVHDVVHAALGAPSRFVLGHAVLQVQHGVFLLPGSLVFGRGVHHGPAPPLLAPGIVLHRAHLALGHPRLRAVIVAFLPLGHLYLAGHAAASEDGVGVGVRHAETVHLQKIVVAARHQRVGHAGPHAVPVLFHRIFLAAHVHRHAAGLWGMDGEVGTVLPVERGRRAARKIGFRGDESGLVGPHLRAVGHLPPVEVHEPYALLALEGEIEVVGAADGVLHLCLHGGPVGPPSGVAGPYFCNLLAPDAVQAHLHHAAPHAAGHGSREEAGPAAQVHLAHLDVVTVVSLRDVHAVPGILFRLHATREGDGLGLHPPEGVEPAHGVHALVRVVDEGERAVGIVLELLHGCTPSETASSGQLARVVEEVGAALVVGHAAVVGKRFGVLQRHDGAHVFPGAHGRVAHRIGDVLGHAARGIQQHVLAPALGYPGAFGVAVLVLRVLHALVGLRGTESFHGLLHHGHPARYRHHVLAQPGHVHVGVAPVQVGLPVIVDEHRGVDVVP